MSNLSDYSLLSKTLTSNIDKLTKKQSGIFFTPPKTIDDNLSRLEPFIKNIDSVLEPSCGSCEFILKIRKRHPALKITGIELNKTIFDSIKIYEDSHTKLINSNFLTHNFDRKFDLIIGNPPYYVMKKTEVDSSYYKKFDGRPNIFLIFILKSLKLLNDDGILDFVLPKSFLNCLYYDKTRKEIARNYTILDISECTDKYLETEQETIIFTLKNKKPVDGNELYIIEKSSYTIFGTPENIKSLKKLYECSKTLSDLDFSVHVGNIVWNQCKNILTSDESKTLLIYSSDITSNKLNIKSYSNQDKKNYIDKKGNTEPVLVVNRGYGVGSYNINYCIINENSSRDYLVENHLICIKYNGDVSSDVLVRKYKQVIKSLENPKTNEFIKLYFGNNAVNTTELHKILPIY